MKNGGAGKSLPCIVSAMYLLNVMNISSYTIQVSCKIFPGLLICVLVAGCGQTKSANAQDVRFQVVTRDGDTSGIPKGFFDEIAVDALKTAVFKPALAERVSMLEVSPEQYEKGQQAKNKTTSLLLVEKARKKDEIDLLADSIIVLRVYWKTSTDAPRSDLTNSIRCVSGAKVPVSLGRRLFAAEIGMATFDEQYFAIPALERPSVFVTKDGDLTLKIHTWEQAKEEASSVTQFMWSDKETYKADAK
jgi:hypothetical protein